MADQACLRCNGTATVPLKSGRCWGCEITVLRAELDQIKREAALEGEGIAFLREGIRVAKEQADVVRHVNHNLADMLRALEYQQISGLGEFCPWCEVQKPKHADTCKLKILINLGYITHANDGPTKMCQCGEPLARHGGCRNFRAVEAKR